MKNISRRNIGGFTLVEILVVVLIIGILSAVAVPMYQGAVDKSRWSTLLTSAKALQTAQEVAHMENGSYSSDLESLDIALAGNIQDNTYYMTDGQYSIETKAPSQSSINGHLNTLPNVRLSMALKMPDNYLFCEAKAGDARAQRLCEKLLMGQKAGSKNGYDKYILDYDGPCAWANTTGQCYVSEEARCSAMGMPYSNGFCGYTDGNSNTVVNEGGECDTSGGGCRYLTVNEGGVCNAGGYAACYHITVNDGGVCQTKGVHAWECEGATINKGGVCIGNSGSGCTNLTVDGGKCIANVQGACAIGIYGKYINGGCCEGEFCPNDVPKC